MCCAHPSNDFAIRKETGPFHVLDDLWLTLAGGFSMSDIYSHHMSLHVTTRSRGVALFAPLVYRVRHNS